MVGSTSAAYNYKKAGLFNGKLALLCLPGVMIGSLLAPFIFILDTETLRWYIGVMIIVTAVYKLFTLSRKKQTAVATFQPLLIFMMGVIAATLSGMAGVAIGVILIPFITRYVDHRTALGTNLLVAVPYAILGSSGYIISGLQEDLSHIPLTVGYVYLPAFCLYCCNDEYFSCDWVTVGENIPTAVVQWVFYVYLLCAGIMILSE